MFILPFGSNRPSGQLTIIKQLKNQFRMQPANIKQDANTNKYNTTAKHNDKHLSMAINAISHDSALAPKGLLVCQLPDALNRTNLAFVTSLWLLTLAEAIFPPACCHVISPGRPC